MLYQRKLVVNTEGRGTYDITAEIRSLLSEAGAAVGLCHVFIHHTSASLIVTENADLSVRRDLDAFMARLVPDGDPLFEHDAEGMDDMPAHVRSMLTQSGLAIPIINWQLGLGTWQGIYVWEHRTMAHRREITVSVLGADNPDPVRE
ncbi:MAG: YjbQ family protein [Gammaproteobacteria bacterium]|nr:YjbQ family protein [Gammaproteobacteria bacterium]